MEENEVAENNEEEIEFLSLALSSLGELSSQEIPRIFLRIII